MKDNSKFMREVKAVAFFLVGGLFAKLHKEFMDPSPDMFPIDHWTNKFHHWLHFGIGATIQILICLWLLRAIVKWGPSLFTGNNKDMPQDGEQHSNQ